MKRYLLFQSNWYYPHIGMKDFVGSYDNIDEAIKNINQNDEFSSAVIFDQSLWKNVYRYSRCYKDEVPNINLNMDGLPE